MFPNLKTSPNTIEKYCTDESGILHADPLLTKGVCYPKNSSDIIEILKEANASNTACTVSGGGTGITGSRVPMDGGIVVSMEKMLCVDKKKGWEHLTVDTLQGHVSINLDRDNLLAEAAPGVSLETLSDILPEDLFYPPDPTESGAFLGGTAATNASGARSFYFGPTRKWIEAMEVILPDGEKLTVKRGTVLADMSGTFNFTSESGKQYSLPLPSYNSPDLKNAAGIYVRPDMDLIDLFIGCEGVFGVITRLLMKLEKKPESMLDTILFFKDAEKALGFVDVMREGKDHGVCAVEFFDENALSFMRDKESKLGESMNAAVFLELMNADDATLEWLAEESEKYEVQEDWFAEGAAEIQKLKDFRHSLPEGVNSYLKQRGSSKIGTDFCVPSEHFREMYDLYLRTGEEFIMKFPREGTHYVLFGHIGNEHLHFNFITHSEEERAFAKELYLKMAQKAVSLGGTISAEHGVGKKTIQIDGKPVPYFYLMVGEKGLREIADMKRILDPKGILNTGNVVGKEYLKVKSFIKPV